MGKIQLHTILIIEFNSSFLDALPHLYKRVCPSVRRSVGPSGRRSFGPSVGHAFVKITENGVMQDGDASYVVYTALFFFGFEQLRLVIVMDMISSEGKSQPYSF